MSSKICIIGTTAAGKTVFTSVLAERFASKHEGMPWLEYKNAKTKLYTTHIWSNLVDKQEWPPSTPAGTLPQLLQWTLHLPNGEDHELEIFDAPGQDIQSIYMADPNGEELSKDQELLKTHVEEANILIILVNVCDIVRAPDSLEAINFTVPIVMAVRQALENHVKIAILLSQYDQLVPLLEQDNEIEPFDIKDSNMVIKRYLPTLHSLIASFDDSVYNTFISSVANTEIHVETLADGSICTSSIPAKNFDSIGFDSVMSWLSKTLESQYREITKTMNIPKTIQYIKLGQVVVSVLMTIMVIMSLITVLSKILPEQWGPFSKRVTIPETYYAVNLYSALWGADNITIINNSSDIWYDVLGYITPNYEKEKIIRFKTKRLDPDAKATYEYIYNFKDQGICTTTIEATIKGNSRCYDNRDEGMSEIKQNSIIFGILVISLFFLVSKKNKLTLKLNSLQG